MVNTSKGRTAMNKHLTAELAAQRAIDELVPMTEAGIRRIFNMYGSNFAFIEPWGTYCVKIGDKMIYRRTITAVREALGEEREKHDNEIVEEAKLRG
jgi:hypothetical protein